MIMNKVLCTYTYINMADLQVIHWLSYNGKDGFFSSWKFFFACCQSKWVLSSYCFFHLLLIRFGELQLLFPKIVNLLFLPNKVVLRLCSNLSGFDAALLAYPSRTNLTKYSVWEVGKCHIKSIKGIKSITVSFLVQR